MLGLVAGLQAQVATVPMGGHVTGSGGEMTISLGQCATRTVYDTAVTVNVRTASLTEGVLQPYLTFELNRIDGVEPLSCNVNLYPNPTTESWTDASGGLLPAADLGECLRPLLGTIYAEGGECGKKTIERV